MSLSLSEKRILVTGGTGFIGRRLVTKLVGMGNEVLVLSRSKTPHLLFSDTGGNSKLQFLCCDLTDDESLVSLSWNNVDYIVHMGALIPQRQPHTSINDTYFVNNVISTVKIGHIIPDNISGFVYTSTLDVYGVPQCIPITEKHPLNPRTFYGLSKLAGEQYLQMIAQQRGFNLTVLRLTQVYGPGEPVIKAIPRFINALGKHEPPIIYGDGSDVRDYLYVEDAVNAIVLALANDQPGTYNIATGRGHRIAEVAQKLIDLSGLNLQPIFKPMTREKSEIVLDISLAMEKLNYYPKVSLDEGLRRQLMAILAGVQ